MGLRLSRVQGARQARDAVRRGREGPGGVLRGMATGSRGRCGGWRRGRGGVAGGGDGVAGVLGSWGQDAVERAQ